MDTTRAQQFRAALEEISARLQHDTRSMSEEAHSSVGGQGSGELTNVPQHLGDMGTEEYLHNMNVALLENEQFLAQEVRAAFNRLHDKTFGICEACGEPIIEERLEAIPYARYCTTCAERLDPIFTPNYDKGRATSPDRTLSFGRSDFDSDPRDTPLSDEDAQDSHAVGTPGGGMALGGLAGTTEGHGDPDSEPLEDAMGSSHFDAEDARPDETDTDEVLS